MRQRLLTATLLLLTTVLNAAAQALTDRYNNQRPLVVVSYDEHHVDITKAVAAQLGVPCNFVMKTKNEMMTNLEQENPDLIITDSVPAATQGYTLSKSIIDYDHGGDETIGEIRFVSKDRQLIEQFDDQYMRLKQDGYIAEIEERWIHPELAKAKDETTALHLTDILLFLSALLLVLSLLILWNIRNTRRHTKEVSEMIHQSELIHNYYELEDNQAAHDLAHKYETILCNPFVAIAFYDNKGHLIIENETMKELGGANTDYPRQPLYSADGKITNYLIAVKRPVPAT